MQRGQPWADNARAFWPDEPEMHPTAFEAETGSAYLYRLLGEVNGLRGELAVTRSRLAEMERLALSSPKVQEQLHGTKPRRVIAKPPRLLNLVV